jgi:UDP-N-acetylglucosamine 2-epimerase
VDRYPGRIGCEVNLAVISGSRADYGLLEWPTKLLREDPFFCVAQIKIWGQSAPQALQAVGDYLSDAKPDCILILGDRFEIMAAAMAAHLERIPIAHIGGGDITEGSYDNAMRDCISRMSAIHFATSPQAGLRLQTLGYANIHHVGNPAIDYIRNAHWQKPVAPVAGPYVVVSYQAETIDGTVDLDAVNAAVGDRDAIWIKPNPDRGNEKIPGDVELPHAEFLNLLAYCEEFIGNSSAMFYEAPALGVKTTIIGKRQKGRVVAPGDGKASERIVRILKEHAGQLSH